ncbi:hypothetical protein N8978_01045 [Flavobacteriaceae bacterium]|jgi:uncharacterized membrane protein YgaE (UPF0421/DUF939 family)|nr:hypothetical protein [Flavobacteriaceae bacterium]|tara:strand:- start:283 stop:429 length:147 start_codon:yes stop_codon:yes gene_type:complete
MKKETFLLILRIGFSLMIIAYFIRIKQAINDNKNDSFSKSSEIHEVLD